MGHVSFFESPARIQEQHMRISTTQTVSCTPKRVQHSVAARYLRCSTTLHTCLHPTVVDKYILGKAGIGTTGYSTRVGGT